MPNWSLRSSLASDSPKDFSGDQGNETFNRKRDEAIQLRRAGKTAKEISSQTGIGMTTLKGWFREKELNRVGLIPTFREYGGHRAKNSHENGRKCLRWGGKSETEKAV